MNTFPRFLFVRLLIVCLLALAAVGMVSAAPGQMMVTYPDIAVYGRDSGISATVDVYLPELALAETQHELGIQLGADLPAVLFVPALTREVMQEYAQNLTDRGYGVIAVDYRPQHAVADSMCALAWAHQVGPAFNLDPTHIAAVGTGGGGQIAALMGSADLGWQPTYEGGLVRVDTAAPYPIHGLDRCPYTMPEAPMIEAVATYDAELGTPVALVDPAFQMAAVPPVGTTRAQMVAAFNEFAFAPPDEWRTMVTGREPEAAPVTLTAAESPAANLNLWQLTPPEVAAMYDAPGVVGPAAYDLWAIAPPEVAAMVQDTPQAILIPNPDWIADVAIALPAYWLDGDEPPHLLMVDRIANSMMHADNAIYTELLLDGGVDVRLTELPGCSQLACAPPAMLESLDLFLADVLYSS